MVDFQQKLREMRAATKSQADTTEARDKLFRVTVRVDAGTDGPPQVTEEVVGYEITNITDANFVLRKFGETGKGRLNLPKTRVHHSEGDGSLVIRSSIAISENGGMWASSETWAYGSVETTIDILKNNMHSSLSTVRTRAQHIQEQLYAP